MSSDPQSHHRSWIKRAWYRFTQFVIGTFARVWFRARIEGRRRVPMSGPTVFVCNHESHLDPLLVGVFCPRIICYFARETLFRGAFGWLIRSYDAIPVDQEKSALSGLKNTLKRIRQGDAVLLFPEGSRTLDGHLQPMKGGFITLVRRGKASLAPVGINGAYESLPYKAIFPKPKKLALVYGEPFSHEQLADLSDEQLLELVEREITKCRDRAFELTGHKKR